MEIEVTLSQGDAMADVLRDAIEEAAELTRRRIDAAIAEPDVWHEAAELVLVGGVVRLHRYASILNSMDVAWHPEMVRWSREVD